MIEEFPDIPCQHRYHLEQGKTRRDMDLPWINYPREGGEAAEPSDDLTVDLLRLTAAIVTLVAAIVLGVAG